MLTRILAGIGLVALSGAPLAAQVGQPLPPDPSEPKDRTGTRGANFLELGVGARAMGLAGAYVAHAEGLASLYWNSAGLARLENFAIGYSYSPLYPDLDMAHHFLGVAIPLFGGVVAASFNAFSSGDIERTTLEFPEGGDPLFGPTFDWTGTAVSVHYAFRLTDRLSFGFAGRVTQEGISDAKATFYGVDVGTLFETGLLGTTIGASFNNLGTNAAVKGRATTRRISNTEVFPVLQDVLLDTEEAQMPTVFRFSVMWDVLGRAESLIPGVPGNHRIVVLTDVSDAIDTDTQFGVGLEYGFAERFFLRGGKRWVNEARAPWEFSDGLAGGAGVRVPVLKRNLTIDYAYVSRGDLDNQQIFSFEFGF